ncbi:MAG: hypothetical protein IIC50_04265 [Planctomycetes bacterium]|nr:hypothetical protein [Planctomycetota bacterium]
MPSYPSKLLKYVNSLPIEEQEAKKRLFEQTLSKAQSHGFQSPRFWAMRQIVQGLSEGQIQQKIQRRLDKQK